MFRALGECDDGGGGGVSLMINPQFALCEASVKLRLHNLLSHPFSSTLAHCYQPIRS